MLSLKVGGIHKYLNFRSFKNYTVDYTEALKQLDFPNYKTFYDLHVTYSNFIKKIMTVIVKITPYVDKRVKGTTQK